MIELNQTYFKILNFVIDDCSAWSIDASLLELLLVLDDESDAFKYRNKFIQNDKN